MATRLELRRRLGVRADEVLNYISIGRSRVFQTTFDPYLNVKRPELAMAKDAMVIATWFNTNRKKWSEEQIRRADEMVLDIQQGPEAYFRNLLKMQLGTLDYLACTSWATREHERQGCIDVESNVELRDKIYDVLAYKGGLRKSPEPYRRMLDILHFAFFGPTYRGQGTTKQPWLDL